MWRAGAATDADTSAAAPAASVTMSSRHPGERGGSVPWRRSSRHRPRRDPAGRGDEGALDGCIERVAAEQPAVVDRRDADHRDIQRETLQCVQHGGTDEAPRRPLVDAARDDQVEVVAPLDGFDHRHRVRDDAAVRWQRGCDEGDGRARVQTDRAAVESEAVCRAMARFASEACASLARRTPVGPLASSHAPPSTRSSAPSAASFSMSRRTVISDTPSAAREFRGGDVPGPRRRRGGSPSSGRPPADSAWRHQTGRSVVCQSAIILDRFVNPGHNDIHARPLRRPPRAAVGTIPQW